MAASHPSESTPSLEASPQVLAGRYEVLALIGVGGMGAVYKVRDRELDEVVALKMLKREIADAPGVLERFRREVKLARRVTHPNVARTYDLGEHEGERFITMELIEGESLATRLARLGRISVHETISTVGAICEGLDAAHAAGVVHRDLKPDNVLLARNRVVITDFGVARAQEAGAVAKTAIPIGTPAYMAPEQLEASPAIDARADVYALGAMTFELLTGRLPFEADSVFAVAAMRLTQPPPDPRTHRPDIPETLALLVMRCMARKPEERPTSARDVAARLASMTMPAESTGRAPAHATIEPPAEAAHKTVAVLPFRNGGAPDDEYLVDGLTDDIIDALSMTPGLRVRPRGVVMQHKNAGDPRQLGRDLGVDVVVEGTVRAAGDAVRVSARVLSVEDGFQIWAKRFDGARADVLKIGDDAAHAIADVLTVRKPQRAAIVTDPVAIDLYLRGRHEFLKFWGEANLRAIGLLEQAHARAPEDPLIMAGYAAALARQFGVANSAARSDVARRVAEQAVRLAPNLAEAHVALANVRLHDHDPNAVAAGIVRALALSPLLPEAHDLRARLLLEVAPAREAIEASQRAIQLEPRLVHLRYLVQVRARHMLGELDESDFGEVPSDPDVASVYWIMAGRLSLWSKADPSFVARTTKRMAEANVHVHPMISALYAMLTTGKLPPAVRAVFQERRHDPSFTHRARVFWHQLSAEARSYIGEYPFDDVKDAVALGLFDVNWIDACPLLDPMRGEPEFAALRETVAARARSVLLQLKGGEATLAS